MSVRRQAMEDVKVSVLLSYPEKFSRRMGARLGKTGGRASLFIKSTAAMRWWREGGRNVFNKSETVSTLLSVSGLARSGRRRPMLPEQPCFGSVIGELARL